MITTPRWTEQDDWFSMRQVGDGIYHISEPKYRDDLRCNIYLVKGSERDIIIDTGLGLSSLRRFIAPVSTNPLLVCSHSHYDHMGSNWEFEERVIHPAEAKIVANPTRENTYADPVLKTEDFIELPWPGFDADKWMPQAAPATSLIHDGDMVDLGNRRFEVLNTPGHSWGSICLWEKSSGILFSADTVYEGELFDFLSCSDIPTYVRSMQRLRELDVTTAFAGHGPVLNGAQFQGIVESYIAQHAGVTSA